MRRIRIQSKEDFFSRTHPEPNTGCWIWVGKQTYQGYGQLHKDQNQGFLLAHRYSYFLHYGEFDLNLLVLHKCDNPFCVNPEHLYLGTIQQNVRDRESRNRRQGLKGDLNPKAKLNWTVVGIMRDALNEGFTTTAVGKYFHISQAHVCKIKLGQTWVKK